MPFKQVSFLYYIIMQRPQGSHPLLLFTHKIATKAKIQAACMILVK